jgi:FKBP-type peptidyl-prolyl cis-trans isomerase SlyD
MVVSQDKVVAIDFTMKDSDGQVLDQSDDGQPLSYLHGAGMFIDGLESAPEGNGTGDALQVIVEPTEGYGDIDEDLREQIPGSEFAEIEDLTVSMQFRVNAEDDFVTVVDVNDDEVMVDGNHQLAGVTLHFDVKVRDIRDATEEEIEHGHPHGPGGHAH